MRQIFRISIIYSLAIFSFLVLPADQKLTAGEIQKSSFFIRFKIVQPTGNRFKVIIGGFRHKGDKTWSDWYLRNTTVEAKSGIWTEWIDLTDYKQVSKSKKVKENLINFSKPLKTLA